MPEKRENLAIKSIVALVSLAVCGLLGAWGGADGTSKGWRRLGIPLFQLVIRIPKIINNAWYALIGLVFLPMTLGYGRYDPSDDKPSTFGRLAYKLFPNDALKQDIFIRFCISILTWISVISQPILSGNWLTYTICGMVYILVEILFGAIIQKEGMYTLLGKKLLWEETIRYGTLGVCLMLI